MLLREWWLVGVVADPNTLSSYHFGSEAMLGEGGSHYLTAETYSASALQHGIAYVLLAFGFGLAAFRRSPVGLGIASLGAAAVIVASHAS
jgi:hypothetical protein